ncbi:MAG: hypothetical protein R3338_06720 [Thermoanaerobaculia bacterium]|nr:hypothetical protein [Thermoanaerobaculia bacterium]
MNLIRLIAIAATLTILACGTGPDVPEPSSSPPPASDRDGQSGDEPETEMSSSEATAVLETIYEPIESFYRQAEQGPDGQRIPAEGMRSPDQLRDHLTTTMTAQIADRFIDQLLMERDGDWIVRPTERIVTPQSGPDLASVDVSESDGRWTISARYEKTELYGELAQVHVVERKNGGWQLVELRRPDRD